MAILYSMCWEDPNILLGALKISKQDEVISIASGGENIFAILLKNPKRIVAIDINKEQIFLVKLKVAAIKNLDFEQFIRFIGLKPSTTRVDIYNRLKPNLTDEEQIYWKENLKTIKKGIIHAGKFERYLDKFRKYFLPFILPKIKLKKYLSLNSIQEQQVFFDKAWNTKRYRLLFKIFFSKNGMMLGRKKDYFKYSKKINIADHYLQRAEQGLSKIPIKSNFFMYYILTGTIQAPLKYHPYLDKNNFYRLKKLSKKIEFVNSDIRQFLKETKKESFSKYNLSDIFELKTQVEYEEILKEIIRTSKKDCLICYWNNLVKRNSHQKIKDLIRDKESRKLYYQDRCFFYSDFVIERLVKDT